jgi:hypothetical protein
MIKNTHRTRVNRILHLVGLAFYGVAFAIVIKSGSSDWSNLFPAAILWFGGVSLFTMGHIAEGNFGSITPVLAYRLLSRKLRNYVATNSTQVQTS